MEISRILDDYRQHTILSAKDKGKFRGRVWKEKVLLHEIEGTSVENTFKALKKLIDKNLEETPPIYTPEESTPPRS